MYRSSRRQGGRVAEITTCAFPSTFDPPGSSSVAGALAPGLRDRRRRRLGRDPREPLRLGGTCARRGRRDHSGVGPGLRRRRPRSSRRPATTARSTPRTPRPRRAPASSGRSSGRTQRAEITVTTADGAKTLLFVRGSFSAVSSTSVTVMLKDGTTAVFTLDATTTVRSAGGQGDRRHQDDRPRHRHRTQERRRHLRREVRPDRAGQVRAPRGRAEPPPRPPAPRRTMMATSPPGPAWPSDVAICRSPVAAASPGGSRPHEDLPGHRRHRGDPDRGPVGDPRRGHHEPEPVRQGEQRLVRGDPGRDLSDHLRGRSARRSSRTTSRACSTEGRALREDRQEHLRQGRDERERPRGDQPVQVRGHQDQLHAHLLDEPGPPRGQGRGQPHQPVRRPPRRHQRGRDDRHPRAGRDLRDPRDRVGGARRLDPATRST